MKHAIDLTQAPPAGPEMAEAISNCVHCGFCLPVCPTYHVLGEELDSPRGRIFLMKEALEDQLPVPEVMSYVDKCLGCMACVTACPSGVEYGELLTPFRDMAQTTPPDRDRFHALRRFLALSTLPYPGRLRLALRLAILTRPLQRAVPAGLQPLTQLVPARLPAARPLPHILTPEGPVRARVALLTGCAQTVLAPAINWATVQVLLANGVEVLTPVRQACCGALDMHAGRGDKARALALNLCQSLPPDVDAVLTNAAGCGSGMHEYPLLFKDTPHDEEATRVAHLTQDVSRFLVELGDLCPLQLPQPRTVTYHDACHLQHAQKISFEPRMLLEQVEGLDLVELGTSGFCCGSAGIYNIEQPETATELGTLKARQVLDTQADVVATGNIGCLTQIQHHLRAAGSDIPVRHTMQILADALTQPKDA